MNHVLLNNLFNDTVRSKRQKCQKLYTKSEVVAEEGFGDMMRSCDLVNRKINVSRRIARISFFILFSIIEIIIYNIISPWSAAALGVPSRDRRRAELARHQIP